MGQGGTYTLVYRSADSQWVALYIGVPDLVWARISEIAVDPKLLNTPPTQIFGSNLNPNPANWTNIPAAQPAQSNTATTSGFVRVHVGPYAASGEVDVIAPGTPVVLVGRDAYRTWAKVTYNNGARTGWVSVYYLNLGDIILRDLPIVP